MLRSPLLLLGLLACSQEPVASSSPPPGPPEKIAVPGTQPKLAIPKVERGMAASEGSLEIVAPPPAPIGVSATAKIRVRPAAGFHINTEYPFLVSIAGSDAVTIAKPRLSGGKAGEPGDAETLAETELSIPISLAATRAGEHTLRGTINFGICRDDQCLTRDAPFVVKVSACDHTC